MKTKLSTKPPKRKREVRFGRFNGLKINGVAGGLPYLTVEHRRIHPKFLTSWAEANSAKIEAINNPGPSGEVALLQALHHQRYCKDAAKWAEAMAAERTSWGRSR